MVKKNIPSHLVNQDLLRVFDVLSTETVVSIVGNFYSIRGAKPYEYDFSIMSKQALSRIYERYVSLLRRKESSTGQTSFYFAPPAEESNKNYGGVYTPQYIARFFARYLREQMPPIAFKRLKTLEPAVGSGIFLRTLLEMQCDPVSDGITTEAIERAFSNVVGLDVDPNATQAALLSLSLLHLVLTNRLPENLTIIDVETIKYFQNHQELKQKWDVVLANPPFIPIDQQEVSIRELLVDFMGDDASGRIDTSLAFLKLAVEALKPGGHGLFVLPYAFLIGNHARGMRKLLSETCWIRCLVDLSAVKVFEDSSVYVILLVFQKRNEAVLTVPSATIAKCQDLVNQALQDVVEDRMSEGDLYSLYRVQQDAFESDTWITSPPALTNVNRKLQELPRIEKFMHIRQGFVTAADPVLIISTERMKDLDADMFVPYLSDRDMQVFTVPDKSTRYVFYPFIEGEKIQEEELRRKFKKTWAYLENHRTELEKRQSVIKGRYPWWQPEAPRSPDKLMRPKIITPHIVLSPRFALDLEGIYAVSRSPLLYPKQIEIEEDLLRFFAAVLNSTVCFRYITDHAHKYRSGYSVLEVATLRNTPVPDPTNIPASAMRQLLSLVDERMVASGREIIDIEKQIDEAVLDLYGLSAAERQALGLDISNG